MHTSSHHFGTDIPLGVEGRVGLVGVEIGLKDSVVEHVLMLGRVMAVSFGLVLAWGLSREVYLAKSCIYLAGLIRIHIERPAGHFLVDDSSQGRRSAVHSGFRDHVASIASSAEISCLI